MKKCWIIVLCGVLLSGCGARETFETISDSYVAGAAAAALQVKVELPEDAAVVTMENQDGGKLYLCDDYCVTVQTLAGGNLDGTVRTVTGYGLDDLTLMETTQGNLTRYDLVWTSAGEGGDQVGRAAILDDGNYHYVLSAMADAGKTEAVSEDWQQLFQSFWAF